MRLVIKTFNNLTTQHFSNTVIQGAKIVYLSFLSSIFLLPKPLSWK